ncbi:hypothetical protein MTP99_009247 [Tenebrio molitor]|nr:hypothetical protein MTP99_009247 [Tenebrio molitor]
MKQFFYYFDVADYVIFGAMLLLSALTGLYFGCRGKLNKQREPESFKDYLTGNGNLKSFPRGDVSDRKLHFRRDHARHSG